LSSVASFKYVGYTLTRKQQETKSRAVPGSDRPHN